MNAPGRRSDPPESLSPLIRLLIGPPPLCDKPVIRVIRVIRGKPVIRVDPRDPR
jgi:hypothetical protein